jgi:hypothetical protein|tara:strand:- start:78 stop:197 length:120 start_codon:yes stop_codon:yes gene_type:complete
MKLTTKKLKQLIEEVVHEKKKKSMILTEDIYKKDKEVKE